MNSFSFNSFGLKIQRFFSKNHVPAKFVFIFTGIISTIWFVFRVLPKPQRASYPCVKATAPIASAFVIYLIGLTASVFSLKKSGHYFKNAKYVLALAFLVGGLVLAFVTIPVNQSAIKAESLAGAALAANTPIGTAKGIMPGRVVWVHAPNATNENLTNTSGDYWFQNTDQSEVEAMLNSSLMSIANKETVADAWDAIFKYFNVNHSKGNVGYTKGEKIYVKINLTTSCCGGWSNLTRKVGWLDHMDATPQLCLALLRHLVNVVGANQGDIYFGDPFRRFQDVYWDILHTEFPDVHYMDGNGYNGREKTTLTSQEILKFSDGQNTSRLPQEYVNASYFINMPCLKTHNEGGITLAAKNHQGSIIETGTQPEGQSAMFMHYSLPQNNQGHGKYRHLVDYMSHEQLGGKTLLYIIDGIWAGFNWEGIVQKWNMEPFNGDYPSSLFVSLDPVAVESVCYDFLLEEYKNKNASEKYPYINGADDYLLQAADEANWPAGITYDPEGDGSKISSLGTHEHWNNATDKKYSRNLGTGNGIELVKIFRKSINYPETITMANSDLPSNQVNTLYIDSSMTVWIGTNAGLSRMTETSFTTYSTSSILLNNTVNDIAYDFSTYGKELWIATNGGLSVATFTDVDGITSSTTYVSANSTLADNKVNRVAVDNQHNRWIGTETALSVFRDNNWDSTYSALDINNHTFYFSDYKITDIKPYKPDNKVMISTAGKGVVRMAYDLVDGFTGASTYGQPWSAVSSDNFTAIDVKDAVQWYGTNAGANYHASNLTKDDWVIYNVESGLVSDIINTVVIDNGMNAWLGTSSGISIVLADGGIYQYTTTNGLLNNQVNYLTTDIDGNIWAATSGGIQWFKGIVGNQVALGVPQLIYPANEEDNVPSTIQLSWSKISGATSYHLQLSRNKNFNVNLIDNNNITSTTFTVNNLDHDSAYFWRISASSVDLLSNWSQTNKFYVERGNSLPITQSGKTVELYPNPASENFNISIHTEEPQDIIVTIYSINGKLISTTTRNISQGEGIVTFDVSDRSLFKLGVYIVHVNGKSFRQTCKLNIL